MKINVNSLVILLNRLNVTCEQFLYLSLIHEHMYASLYAYSENNKGFSKQLIGDLVEKGYLECTTKNRKDLYVDSYETTALFKNALYSADKSSAADEFWNAFPSFIVIDAKKIPAKSVDKDKFFKAYYDKVGKYPDLHQRVMSALQYAKVNAMISMGLEKWFSSEQWEEILKDKERVHKREFPNDKIF